MGEHKPGRIKPGRIKRAALSLQNRNYQISCFLIRPRLYASDIVLPFSSPGCINYRLLILIILLPIILIITIILTNSYYSNYSILYLQTINSNYSPAVLVPGLHPPDDVRVGRRGGALVGEVLSWYVCIHVHVYIYIYIYIYTHTLSISLSIYLSRSPYLSIYLSVSISICISLSLYTYTYMHT